MELQVGDWVNSYHAGIWQIYRIAHYKSLNPSSGLEEYRTSVFSKRFISPLFKRSFSQECCHPIYVSKLDEVTAVKLEAFIKEYPDLYKKFLEYTPKPIDNIYNASFLIPDGTTSKEAEGLFSNEITLRAIEIEPYLKSLGLDTKTLPPTSTAQFVSRDYSCENGFLVYKFYRILDF